MHLVTDPGELLVDHRISPSAEPGEVASGSARREDRVRAAVKRVDGWPSELTGAGQGARGNPPRHGDGRADRVRMGDREGGREDPTLRKTRDHGPPSRRVASTPLSNREGEAIGALTERAEERRALAVTSAHRHPRESAAVAQRSAGDDQPNGRVGSEQRSSRRLRSVAESVQEDDHWQLGVRGELPRLYEEVLEPGREVLRDAKLGLRQGVRCSRYLEGVRGREENESESEDGASEDPACHCTSRRGRPSSLTMSRRARVRNDRRLRSEAQRAGITATSRAARRPRRGDESSNPDRDRSRASCRSGAPRRSRFPRRPPEPRPPASP